MEKNIFDILYTILAVISVAISIYTTTIQDNYQKKTWYKRLIPAALVVSILSFLKGDYIVAVIWLIIVGLSLLDMRKINRMINEKLNLN